MTKRSWLQRIIEIFNVQLVLKSNLMPFSERICKKKKIEIFIMYLITISDKSVETFRSKIRISPIPPQTRVILFFQRLHRPQRLHNIELRVRNIIELRLNVKELEEELNYGKASLSKCLNIFCRFL